MDTNTITIEPKGDLLLIIGPSKTPILVSSESLGEVSPIWKALLAHLPDFASTRHRLALPKDSLNAMLALLHACHHQWDRVPDDRFPERDVVDVAILCQKYECAELMCPFRPHWLYGRETPRHVSHEDWAFACLVLGHGFAFLRLAGTLVRWNEGGGRLNLGDARGNPNGEGEKYKKTMKKKLAAVRETQLAMLKYLAEVRLDRRDGRATCGFVLSGRRKVRLRRTCRLSPNNTTKSFEYEDAIPVTFAAALGRTGLEPIHPPGYTETTVASVEAVADGMKRIRFACDPCMHERCAESWRQWGFAFRDGVARITGPTLDERIEEVFKEELRTAYWKV